MKAIITMIISHIRFFRSTSKTVLV